MTCTLRHRIVASGSSVRLRRVSAGMCPAHRRRMTSQSEGARPSIWDLTAEVPAAPRLTQDITADVCIIGAGMAGMSTAYELTRAGRSVVVLDDGRIGGGETG